MPILKSPALLIAATAAVVGALLALLGGGSVHQGLVYLGIPTLKPLFADLRLVLTGVDCAATGHEVLVANPCDPWKRPFNYPTIWLAVFGALGWGQRAALPLGFAAIALFAAAVLYVFRGVAAGRIWPVLAALFSPAVMFLLERGNNDIFIFCLLTLAVALRGRLGAAGTLGASPALIALAAVAKLYPAVALAVMTRGWDRRQLIAGGIAAAAVIAVFAATADDIAKIAAGTVTSVNMSFGRDILVHFADRQMLLGLGGAQTGISIALAIAALGAAAFLCYRLRRDTAAPTAGSAETQDFFIVGAAVFCGAFLAGRNWDYRLCFLLMCLPQALAWMETGPLRRLGAWLAGCIVFSMWAGFLVPTVWTWNRKFLAFPTLDEVSNWIVFTLCLAGIALILWPGRRTAGATTAS